MISSLLFVSDSGLMRSSGVDVSRIFDKLGATDRTEAVTHARELGLIS